MRLRREMLVIGKSYSTTFVITLFLELPLV